MRFKMIAVMGVSVLLTGGVMMNKLDAKETDTGLLRVAFPYAQPSRSYDPAKIHLAPEYIFLENTFSPLVEMNDKTGQIQPGVAKSYDWIGNDLHLKIRPNLKTIDGKPITAEDAAFSLKRLLSLPGNTHGDFQELLCGVKSGQSVEQHCGGISVVGDELILKTTPAGRTFLLPMLVTADFSIIPKSSVDPKTLEIRDFRNTSGPYYVARDSESGEIELSANPNHYHYSAEMPQRIRLIPTDKTDQHASVNGFKAGKFDFITTIDAARADDVIAFSRTQSDAVLHTTMNIRSFVLVFSQRGLQTLSAEIRRAIGARIHVALVKQFAGENGFEESKQFFPVFGEGALSKEKIGDIGSLAKDDADVSNLRLKMTLVRLGDTTKFVEAIKSVLPNVEVSEAPKNPNFTKYDSNADMPEMAITGPDTGFQEDIGLITYSLNAGYFGMDKDSRREWLKKYMETPDKAARLDLLSEVHEQSLRAPAVVPMLIAPYAAIMRKPWNGGLSQLFANTHIWLMRRN